MQHMAAFALLISCLCGYAIPNPWMRKATPRARGYRNRIGLFSG